MVAVDRLGLSWREFARITPLELAWRLWGLRRRQTAELRRLTWALAVVVAPHVSEKSRSHVSARSLYLAASGGDLDDDELPE
jgi:hypothetical protein